MKSLPITIDLPERNTPAFRNGEEAYLEGKKKEDCPYSQDTELKRLWLAGYNSAQRKTAEN